MNEPLAYLNGRCLPLSEARLPFSDLGLQGMAVTETVRTFHQRLFRLDDHLRRLEQSLELACLSLPVSIDELRSVAVTLAADNARLLPGDDELGLTIFVTAGPNPTYLGASAAVDRQATVGAHTWRLPVELWAERCLSGQHLVTPALRQIPASTLDPRIKSRSRLHWHLAECQARERDPQATAVLLDATGNLTETATANFFIVRGGAILTPQAGTALAGVGQAVVHELADEAGIAYREADIRPGDVLQADEAFTSSTPYCLMPVVRLNGRAIGNGKPGPVFAQLVGAWSALVGVDLMSIWRGVADRERRS